MMKCTIAATGTLMLGLAVVPASAQDAQASENWSAVVRCAASARTEDRHACVDAVLRGAGVLDPVRETQQLREEFGQSESARPAPPPPPVAPPPPPVASAPARPAAPVASPPQELDGIVTTITDARRGSRGELLVLTAEGAIWRQLSSERIRRVPDAGNSIEIETTALGGYRCIVAGGESYRCERAN